MGLPVENGCHMMSLHQDQLLRPRGQQLLSVPILVHHHCSLESQSSLGIPIVHHDYPLKTVLNLAAPKNDESCEALRRLRGTLEQPRGIQLDTPVPVDQPFLDSSLARQHFGQVVVISQDLGVDGVQVPAQRGSIF